MSLVTFCAHADVVVASGAILWRRTLKKPMNFLNEPFRLLHNYFGLILSERNLKLYFFWSKQTAQKWNYANFSFTLLLTVEEEKNAAEMYAYQKEFVSVIPHLQRQKSVVTKRKDRMVKPHRFVVESKKQVK